MHEKDRTEIGTYLYWFWNFSVAPFILYMPFIVCESFHIKILGDPWNLRDGISNLKSLRLVHTFLGETLTNGKKIRQICRRGSNNIDEL